MSLVILDNYDSFTFNLFQLVAEISAEISSDHTHELTTESTSGPLPLVLRNNNVTLDEIRDLRPDRILISPGPGSPENPDYFGVCRSVILELGRETPILGVCLGHLGLAEAFGGRIVRAPQPRHGRSSPIRHGGTSIFQGLADPLEGMRYHSLIVERESLPDCLELTAWTDDGLIMGIKHREFPLIGVQFHPESIGTPLGKDLIRAFLQE
ncbi:MAG: aminodeoxychorismate/anthranilate synthase component II [Gemmatimonadales bacterium]|nr:aminodeoxychorismate/anthranilate synthase component II [Gemmatimonadales bacterium]